MRWSFRSFKVAFPVAPSHGALSVMVQVAARPRIAFRVPAGAFYPPPRVASAVLVLEPLASPRAEITDDGWFSDVVHAAFGQRRKTLRNALGSLGEPALLERALAAAEINPGARGETLDVERFARLAEALLRERGGRLLPRPG